METSLRTLSVVVLSTYLTAALLPCQPPSGWQPTAATSHAVASDASDEPEAVSADPSNTSSGEVVPIAKAEFKAKCPCGCDESTVEVGGAARLGRVVPGVHLPRMVELSASAIAGPVDAFFDEFHEELDPAPI